METLLTESMVSSFSSSVLLQGSSLRKLSSGSVSGTAGEFPPKRYAAGVNRISRAPLIVRLSSPWIDYRRREVVKVRQVSSRQGRVARKNDPCDHRVAQLARAALDFPRSHQSARLSCGLGV